MKVVITTQYRENYGAHTWDGSGACPQYWKDKFGDEYVIPVGSSVSNSSLIHTVNSAISQIERSDNYVEIIVVDWVVMADDVLTEAEQHFPGSAIMMYPEYRSDDSIKFHLVPLAGAVDYTPAEVI